MVVGDDVAVLRDEEAGPERAGFLGLGLFLFAFLLLAALFEEVVEARQAAELFEELLHVAEVVDLAFREDVDADNRRFNLLDQVREAHRCARRRLDRDGLRARLRAENLGEIHNVPTAAAPKSAATMACRDMPSFM